MLIVNSMKEAAKGKLCPVLAGLPSLRKPSCIISNPATHEKYIISITEENHHKQWKCADLQRVKP